MREKTEVDVIGDEGRERSKASAEGVQNLEQGVESMFCVLKPVLALETAAVKTNVPVGGVVNEL